jgi:hypothetical protein
MLPVKFSLRLWGACVPLALSILAVPASATTIDEAPAINAAISTAIKNGVNSVTLEPRIYNLQSSIVIPAGTRNFSLLGAGSERTLLRTTVRMGHAIRAGQIIWTHNNWGITGAEQTPVGNVGTGANRLVIAKGVKLPPPGDFVLWDEYSVRPNTDTNNSLNRAEIVRITQVDQTRRVVHLAAGIGREYHVKPKLAFVGNTLSSNITIAGIGFDGRAADGSTSEGLLFASLIRGLEVDDLRVRNFTTGAIRLVQCQDAVVSNSHVSDASAGGPGGGYGFFVIRSRFVTIRNSTARSMRHGWVLHSGTMDATVQDCDSFNADYDSHGYDERRVTFRRCTGNVGINIGNAAWHAGANGVLIEGSVLPGRLYVGPNVTNLTVRGSTIGSNSATQTLTLESFAPTSLGNPSGGSPGTVRFESSRIVGFNHLVRYAGTGHAGDVSFVNCDFLQTKPEWGVLLFLENASGNFSITGSRMEMTSNYPPVNLAGGTDNLRFSMTNTIVTAPGERIATWLRSTFSGAATIRDNLLRTRISPAQYLRNESSGTVQAHNNLVEILSN